MTKQTVQDLSHILHLLKEVESRLFRYTIYHFVGFFFPYKSNSLHSHTDMFLLCNSAHNGYHVLRFKMLSSAFFKGSNNLLVARSMTLL